MDKNIFPFYTLSISQVGAANTVSSGPDNGANNCMAGKFWNCMRHSTFEQAVNNFLSRLPALVETPELTSVGNLNIGGHGNEGFLTTGCGQTGQQNYQTNTMATWNRNFWQPHFIKLRPKNFSILSIYSCHSGAGVAGADFLFALAQAIGHPCQGRTGFTYCGSQGISFENNSVWQVATPTSRPNPINAPTPHFNYNDLNMFLEIDGTIEDVSYTNIKSIKLTKVGYLGVRSIKDLEVNTTDLPEISNLIFASQPFKIDGVPLAELTGVIEVEFMLGKSSEKRVFDLYNDRIIIDRKTGQNYYVNPALINFMSNQ